MSRAAPEAALQAGIVEFAGLNGWRCYHPPDNRPITTRSGRRYVQNVQAGYLDLTLGHEQMARLVIAELKSETGRLSDAQEDWLRTLHAIAAAMYDDLEQIPGLTLGAEPAPAPRLEVYVWRPADWPEIERVLTWER